jgi:acyl-CoA oxidase
MVPTDVVSFSIMLLGLLCTYFAIAFGSFILTRPKRRKVDKATLHILTEAHPISPKAFPLSNAMNTAPIFPDELRCAEQLRTIIASEKLLYKTLEKEPDLLMDLNKYMGDQEIYGALWTRFTVQYNLFAGSIVAMGSASQREKLYSTQSTGDLGCFAFTECGAGVLSGAAIETTATYNVDSKTFTIHSPTISSRKKWISQGMFAEHAVICANLIIQTDSPTAEPETNKGPHLFFARIQDRDPSNGSMQPLPGVKLESLPPKTALLGLDNAYVSFDNFQVQHSALLSRFSSVDADTAKYSLTLPKGVKRMLDLLISRLLTGRIVLSEFTIHHSIKLMRHCWAFASSRELWKGKKAVAQKISDLPLMQSAFMDYSRSLQVVSHYIAVTREDVVKCIKTDVFTNEVVEGACISKFVGTSFAVDIASVLRKLMGSEALFAVARLLAKQSGKVGHSG